MLDEMALGLYVIALIVLFGVRSWLQHRRTGRTGFHGISGTPATLEWWGGILFVAAMICGLLGPLLAVTGTMAVDGPELLRTVGLVIALIGFAATLAGQSGMGASWRIGVDPSERTDLVTGGVFGVVRNPIFTAVLTAQFGLVLLVPSWLTALAFLLLLVAVEIQVRAVEEPYLRAAHGPSYDEYCSRVGRFLPAVGRRLPAEPAPVSAP